MRGEEALTERLASLYDMRALKTYVRWKVARTQRTGWPW